MYSKVGHAWQSKGFVPSVSFAEVQDLHANNRGASLAALENGVQQKKNSVHVETEKY